MNDLRNDAWITHLRSELPFPQPRYGAAEPPGSTKELLDRLTAVDLELEDILRGDDPWSGDAAEPDWFIALCERHLPVASWYAGLGLAASTSVEIPERFWDFVDRARRIPRVGEGIGQGVERLRENVTTAFAKLSSQNLSLTTSYFSILKLHYEALLRPLGEGDEAVEVSFDFPAPGSRAAELVPPPAPGSPTHGAVGRVTCPAMIVRVRTIHGARTFARGAHFRSQR